MGFYGDHVLPRVLDAAMGTEQAHLARARVTAGLAGEVLEIGFGTGHNLRHLPAAVDRLLAVEPSGPGLRRAQERISASAVPVELVGRDAQRLALPDASVDAALCTWTLCSIPDPVAALREVARVLRPGGLFCFVEHGLAHDPGARRWQARLNPVQRRLVGGCTLDRDVPAVVRRGGLEVTRLETYVERGSPRAFATMYEGTAVRA